ncbi:ScbA/BarX family gamma-butyrolactone biosynthesis protein [Streptomyces sp. MOE7]|uniref:ScbA/BarX family gamma-butyrolactone biosynthesis protein n=1 Tax=Streptomyces sp. MOE7 TaxID=1961713 RepID=UPI0009FCF7C0|nr:ScbA/BarX family gamma-butyrolactone biosynthesis protein [Streptomyces sp. MOE7]
MSETMHVSGTVQPKAPHRTRLIEKPCGTPRVPREFVHRPIVDDILVTSWRRQDDSHFSVTAQWPEEHGYFASQDGRHHLILTGETIRQAGLLLSHTELGVPVGHHFILGDLDYTTYPEHLDAGSGPIGLSIDVSCSKMRMRAGTLAGARFDMTLRAADRIVATGHSHVTVASPAVYRRIRGEQLTARRTLGPLPTCVPPRLTGSTSEHDVLLSPTDRPDSWLLRIAPGHAAVVNPANDHVPGMVLLDAAQQAAHALTAPGTFVPYAFGTTFHRYAEHGTPCAIEARRVPSALPGTTAVQVTGSQDGHPVFVSTLTARDSRG